MSQPGALHVYLRRPVVTPAAIERMDAMLGVLREAGFDEPLARRAYGAIHTYTIGFAALQASRHQSATDDEDADAMVKELAKYTTPSSSRKVWGSCSKALRETSEPKASARSAIFG